MFICAGVPVVAARLARPVAERLDVPQNERLTADVRAMTETLGVVRGISTHGRTAEGPVLQRWRRRSDSPRGPGHVTQAESYVGRAYSERRALGGREAS